MIDPRRIRVLLVGALVLMAACSTTGSGGVASPTVATSGGPGSQASTAAPASASPELCADKAALQTALDGLAALNPRTAPRRELIEAVGAVGLAEASLATSAQGIPNAQIQALRIATELATRLVPNGGSEEIATAVKGVLTKGEAVIRALPAC